MRRRRSWRVRLGVTKRQLAMMLAPFLTGVGVALVAEVTDWGPEGLPDAATSLGTAGSAFFGLRFNALRDEVEESNRPA